MIFSATAFANAGSSSTAPMSWSRESASRWRAQFQQAAPPGAVIGPRNVSSPLLQIAIEAHRLRCNVSAVRSDSSSESPERSETTKSPTPARVRICIPAKASNAAVCSPKGVALLMDTRGMRAGTLNVWLPLTELSIMRASRNCRSSARTLSGGRCPSLAYSAGRTSERKEVADDPLSRQQPLDVETIAPPRVATTRSSGASRRLLTFFSQPFRPTFGCCLPSAGCSARS